jgi:hypothetical protein
MITLGYLMIANITISFGFLIADEIKNFIKEHING